MQPSCGNPVLSLAEVQIVGGPLLHSKKNGDGYVSCIPWFVAVFFLLDAIMSRAPDGWEVLPFLIGGLASEDAKDPGRSGRLPRCTGCQPQGVAVFKASSWPSEGFEPLPDRRAQCLCATAAPLWWQILKGKDPWMMPDAGVLWMQPCVILCQQSRSNRKFEHAYLLCIHMVFEFGVWTQTVEIKRSSCTVP